MSDPIQSTEAGAVAALVRDNFAPICHTPELLAIPHLTWPRDGKVESLERLMAKPIRKRAAVTVRDHQSFIEYVDRNQETGTIIFAEITEAGGSFTAIIDYHEASPEGVNGGVPGWGDHTCKFICEHTPEWKRSIAISGKPMSQTDLAVFIEDNRLDINSPDGGTMLDLVKSLEATSGVEFKSAVRLDNGDRTIHYAHTTTAKAGVQGDLTIPDTFVLSLQVFTNGPFYPVDARFRYKITEGHLQMRVEIVRPHKVVELAMHESRDAINKALQLPVLLGSGSVTGK